MKLNVQINYVPHKKEQGKQFWLILVTDIGTCKGRMGWEPKPNERLILEGDWQVYQGKKEFKFSYAMPDIPLDSRAQLSYICQITTGIGDALEVRIWDELGEDWPKIEDGDVKGMSGKKLAAFRQSMEDMERNQIQVNTLSFLMSKGCTLTLANKAWEEWEQETIGIVQSNCFRLTDLDRCGFCHIDDGIRQAFGINDSDPRRIKAGILYALKQIENDGSTVALWERLHAESAQLLKLKKDLIFEAAAAMIKDGTIIGFRETKMVAAARDYLNEKLIYEACA